MQTVRPRIPAKSFILIILAGCILSCSTEPDPVSKIIPEDSYTITVALDGTVWTGCIQGLMSWSADEWKLHDIDDLEKSTIRDMIISYRTGSPELWVAHNNGVMVVQVSGDSVISHRQYKTSNSGLLDDDVYAVVEDSQGNIWFASPSGLSILADSHWYNELNRGLLAMYPVNCLAARSDGFVMGGTSGLGVARHKYDDQVDAVTGASYYTSEWSGLQSDQVLSAMIEENDDQWFGTEYGLYEHRSFETKIEWTMYTRQDGLLCDTIISIVMDQEGVFWYGSPHGLVSYDGNSWNSFTVSDGLAGNEINDLAINADGVLWVATNKGVSTITDGIVNTFE